MPFLAAVQEERMELKDRLDKYADNFEEDLKTVAQRCYQISDVDPGIDEVLMHRRGDGFDMIIKCRDSKGCTCGQR